MTNREFFTNIINGTINEEVIAHATTALEKMDTAIANRKNKPSKTALANAPILEAITGRLTAEAQTASEIGAALEISTQKASSLLRQLVASGVAVSTEVKGPKGVVKAYTLA